ncbi:hypothetical protein [Nocardia sp. NPDC024068]|uniref:hypothetical protein n=1 Tax=Nocardia sp. NPDC024068 TaxID=3157197 RepID=UPI0033E2D010
MSTAPASPSPGEQPPPPGADPLDPTVLDLLRGSALAPMLDMPVNDILANLGLPGLPEFPAFGQLPGMPPLPTIDLSALMRPLTDLASAFGTGQFAPPALPAPAAAGDPAAAPAAPPIDPMQMLSQVGTVMQSVLQVAPQALQTVMQLWQGMGAMEAATKSGQATADAGNLEAQSLQEKQHLGEGAVTVGTGAALMTAVISAFAAKLGLAPLYCATPGGQALLVAFAVEAGSEGLAVTAKTKGELAVESGLMVQAGQKVPVTSAPTGVDPSEQLNQLMQVMGMVTPLISSVGQVAGSIGQAVGQSGQSLSQFAAQHTRDGAKPAGIENGSGVPGEPGEKKDISAGGGLGGGMPGVGLVGGGAPAALNAFPGSKIGAPGPLGAVGAPGGLGNSSNSVAGMSSAANSTGASSGASNSPGYMPMGAGMGAAGMARDGESITDGSARGPVSAEYGDEVVGRMDGIAVPVVGAADTDSEPPPDKELTL